MRVRAGPVRKPAKAADALAQGKEELHTALAELEKTLANTLPDDPGAVRLDSHDKLVIPKLTAEDVPAEAKELKDELAGRLPFAPIASLLIELDVRTAFLDCFTHADGRKQAHSADLKPNILAVLIAMATNPGPGQDERGVWRLLRRAGLDCRMVRRVHGFGPHRPSPSFRTAVGFPVPDIPVIKTLSTWQGPQMICAWVRCGLVEFLDEVVKTP